MKKIINSPDTVVQEMCAGIALAHPEISLIAKHKILLKKTLDPDKVSLISGGGSGHEPAHAGFVGKGMLDAAVCGDVFASPSQIQVYHALKATASKKGTLMIIKNYSGDVMNFKNAAALAEGEVDVDYVIVNDDIAVKDSLYTVGRRGVAGTVLVHKAAGAAAEQGCSLEEVKAAAQEAIDHVRSVGFALTSCTVPSKGTPTFSLGDDEMEYGVGIHGEPGVGRQPLRTADELAAQTVSSLVQELSLKHGDEVTLLVNGFGATPLQELYLLNTAVCRQLAAHGIILYRIFVGNYMTSIDMAGASVSVMQMTPRLKELIDAPCDAPAFRVSGSVPPSVFVPTDAPRPASTSYGALVPQSCAQVKDGRLTRENVFYLVDRMGSFIIANEVPFCELDSHAGDGDFGMSVSKGFKRLKEEWASILDESAQDIGAFLSACAFVIMEHCGGASGPIWGSAFHAAGKTARGKQTLTAAEVSALLDAAVRGIQQTGERSFGRGAVVGDKTLIDALVPCAAAWQNCPDLKEGFRSGAAAAVQGAKETEKIAARMGRAGTVGARSIGYPDAGAYALGEIFTDLCRSLQFT